MTPRISVVMPVYNGERFVGEAIDSILGQTLRDFELIVVDDASTDDTPDILHVLAEGDSRVRIRRMTSNGGAVRARNAGIAIASSSLIATMDADDVSLPSRLARQAQFLSEHPEVGIVGSFVQLIDDAGTRGLTKEYPTTPALTAWSLLFFSSVCHPAMMARRGVIEQLGGYAMDCKGGTEDFELLTRASRITKVTNIPEVLVWYRHWGGNMTRTQWDAQEADANRIVRESVARLIGWDGTMDIGRSLRGLATDQYPATTAEVRTLGDLIPRLCSAFLANAPLDPPEHSEVKLDAAVKLWLLAALAIRRSPELAAKLGYAASRMHAGAAAAFARKAVRRLVNRR